MLDSVVSKARRASSILNNLKSGEWVEMGGDVYYILKGGEIPIVAYRPSDQEVLRIKVLSNVLSNLDNIRKL